MRASNRARALNLTIVIGLGASLATGSADAQPATDPVAARALFQEGRKLAADSKWTDACPKFERSLSLDPGIGTMFNLADCYEHVGRTASAWSTFLDAAAAAKNSGQGERERIARKRAATLEPHLSRLTITVTAPPPSLAIKDGTRAMTASLYGEAVPVDPGDHQIEASAPGKKPWHTTAHVNPDSASVSVAVPVLEDGPKEAIPLNAPVAEATPAPTPVFATEPGPKAKPWQWTAGWVVGGIGVAGVGVGAVFGILTLSKNSDAKGICVSNPGNCSAADVNTHTSDVNSAKTDRTVSIIGFAAGGAAIVAGATLLLTAPKSRETALTVMPLVGPGQLGASVASRF